MQKKQNFENLTFLLVDVSIGLRGRDEVVVFLSTETPALLLGVERPQYRLTKHCSGNPLFTWTARGLWSEVRNST